MSLAALCIPPWIDRILPLHILVHTNVDKLWFLVFSEPLPPAQTLLLTLQAPLKTENSKLKTAVQRKRPLQIIAVAEAS